MKVLHFHFMPYTDLPADFPQSDKSIWVDVDSRLLNTDVCNRNFHDFLDQIRMALT